MCYGIHGECAALSVLFLCSNLTVQQVDVFIFLFIQLCNTSIVILQPYALSLEIPLTFFAIHDSIFTDKDIFMYDYVNSLGRR